MAGMYLEDFELGKLYTSQGRTITETDVVNFAGLTGDFNPLHMDEQFATTKSVFKKRIAHGALGFVIMTGLSNLTGMYMGTTIAFLDAKISYPCPLCIGDTVHLEMTPIEIRHSSKPGKGILKLKAQLVNQDGGVPCDCEWTLMMFARE